MQGTYTSSTLYKDPIRVNRILSSVKERSSKKGGKERSESNVKTPKLPHQDDRNGIVTTLCAIVPQRVS
jgi:hypothetical protein